MTKYLIGLALVFSSLTTFAFRNPQMRACISVGGSFTVVNGEFDQYGICQFGPSLVGAIDILNRDSAIEIPLSLFNYKRGIKACPTQNLTTLYSFENDPIYVCQYSDASIIDIETLSSGKDSERNKELNKALNLK